MLLTDGHASYPGLTDYRHDPRIVGKMAGHVVLPWIHRAFSLMKRWSLGTYHGLRRTHVDTYLNEFVFRYNTAASTGTFLCSKPCSGWPHIMRLRATGTSSNETKSLERGFKRSRRTPRRRKTATGMRQDGAPPALVLPRSTHQTSASTTYRRAWDNGISRVSRAHCTWAEPVAFSSTLLYAALDEIEIDVRNNSPAKLSAFAVFAQNSVAERPRERILRQRQRLVRCGRVNNRMA